MFFIIGICLMNLFISFMNARNCGLIWCESKAVGGWVCFLVWCGAIQSAIGFTSVYMVVAVAVAGATGYFGAEDMRLFLEMVYILIIIPAVGSGLVIALSSWIHLARNRSLANLTVAGWNTFAQARNMYHAYRAFGPASESVLKALGGRGRRKNISVIMLAIFVLVFGILTTTVIIRRYAGELAIPEEIKNRFRERHGRELPCQ